MKTAIVYSSLTGNTKKVAVAIQEVFGTEGELFPVELAPDAALYDLVVIGFWVDKGTADSKTRNYLQTLHDKRVALFATLGADPDSKHATECLAKATALLAPGNQVVGTFICQGKVDPRLVEQFKKFPAGHPHAMTQERQLRHAEAAKHPDAKDLQGAKEVFARIKKEVSLSWATAN